MHRIRRLCLPTLSSAFFVISGCATGTQLAGMDFPAFAESVVAENDPALARQYWASRAAVCVAKQTGESEPCVTILGSVSLLRNPQAANEAGKPENRLKNAFANWCAAHGSHADRARPGTTMTDPRNSSSPVAHTLFGAAVANMKIGVAQESSINLEKDAVAYQCTVGAASYGLVTKVVFFGITASRSHERHVLALLYDDTDLKTLSTQTAGN
jgi:hypothetical protein